MCASIFYIIYYLFELDAAERLPIHNGLLVFSIFSILAVVGFFTWVNKTKLGKKYEKMYAKWQKDKIINQAIDEIKGTEYYSTLPEYSGRNKFVTSSIFLRKGVIVFFSVVSLIFVIVLLNIIITDYDALALWAMVCIVLALPIVCFISHYTALDKSVLISEEGVKLCKVVGGENEDLFFTWEEIKTIGLSVAPSGRRISWGYMYFTTKEIKRDKIIPQYFEKPYVIVIKYRPKIVHCTLKYWDKEIRNLEAMKNWKRYIHRL